MRLPPNANIAAYVRFPPIADISPVTHHAAMTLDGYTRFNVRSFNFMCWAAVVTSVIMWVATIADHVLQLGWGWDIQIVWIAPIIAGVALLTRLLGRAISKWMGD